MDSTQNYLVLILLLITSCSVKESNIYVEDNLLISRLEEFKREGVKEASFYIRINNEGNTVLVVANYNIGKCNIYMSSGEYKSIQIQLFMDTLNFNKDYEDLFRFPQKTKCVQPDIKNIEVAPDSEMIYEYEVTKNGLIKLGKW